MNGAPLAVGTNGVGDAEQVPAGGTGAPAPQLKFTGLLYPFSEVSTPLKFTVLFTYARSDGLLMPRE
jgi:hypothetical protein